MSQYAAADMADPITERPADELGKPTTAYHSLRRVRAVLTHPQGFTGGVQGFHLESTKDGQKRLELGNSVK